MTNRGSYDQAVKGGLFPHVGGVSRRVARLQVAPTIMRTNKLSFILTRSSYYYLVLYMQSVLII